MTAHLTAIKRLHIYSSPCKFFCKLNKMIIDKVIRTTKDSGYCAIAPACATPTPWQITHWSYETRMFVNAGSSSSAPVRVRVVPEYVDVEWTPHWGSWFAGDLVFQSGEDATVLYPLLLPVYDARDWIAKSVVAVLRNVTISFKDAEQELNIFLWKGPLKFNLIALNRSRIWSTIWSSIARSPHVSLISLSLSAKPVWWYRLH